MHKGVASRPTSVALPATGPVAGPTTPASVPGNATCFAGLGSPYGGCGLPQSALDSQNFLTLNVFNSPGDDGWHPRPIPASSSNAIGSFDDGPGQAFCRNDSWVSDGDDGATLTILVADSCDISIGFIRSAQPHWPVKTVSHLPNGIHGVQHYSEGGWHAATADSDMDQEH